MSGGSLETNNFLYLQTTRFARDPLTSSLGVNLMLEDGRQIPHSSPVQLCLDHETVTPKSLNHAHG